MFLGVTASVSSWDVDGTCCSIILEDNPLVDFVELPDTCQGLYYCNVLSGVIRGALEMVSFLFFFLLHTLLVTEFAFSSFSNKLFPQKCETKLLSTTFIIKCRTWFRLGVYVLLFCLKNVQVSMKTEVTWTRDVLRGDDAYELQVKLLKQVAEEYPYKDDE